MKSARLQLLLVLYVCFGGASCANREAVRFHGFSDDFPRTAVAYTPQQTYSYALHVDEFTDLRQDHYGEAIAGTTWEGCRTDTSNAGDSIQIVRSRIVEDLENSNLFTRLSVDAPVRAPRDREIGVANGNDRS